MIPLLPRLLAGVVALLSITQAHAQSPIPDLPEANPGRPTVSTPATLTPQGYLQFENGGLFAHTSPEFNTRFAINQVTKFTVVPRLQLLAISEPFVHATGETPSPVTVPARSSPASRASCYPAKAVLPP